MQSWFDAIIALFAAYGIVFFTWWFIALFRARTLSPEFSYYLRSRADRAYAKWLNFAGILPPILNENEEFDGTGIDNN